MTSIALDIAALDPAFKAHAARGTGRYVRELSKQLVGDSSADFDVVSFSSHALLHTGKAARCLDFLPFGRVTARQQLYGPFAFRATGADIVHFPAHIDSPAWCSLPYIVTVLDLIPMIFREMYRADRPSWRFDFARWLECTAIRNACLVLCISGNTAADVERILGIPPERIVVTPLGVDERFFRAPDPDVGQGLRHRLRLPHDGELVLYLGGIDQRKNVKGLIAVMHRLRRRFIENGRTPPSLIIAGDVQGDDQLPELMSYIQYERASEWVYFTGFVEEDDLGSLLAQSSAFFFPSFYEGFGLPPLEAMAAGLPVISSNRSAMPEVLGDAAVYVNPNDFDEGAEALAHVLEDGDFARMLSERGRKHAEKYTWKRTAELTLEAYDRALQRL